MAERQGFEPWEGINPQRFSRPPHSAALPPLQQAKHFIQMDSQSQSEIIFDLFIKELSILPKKTGAVAPVIISLLLSFHTINHGKPTHRVQIHQDRCAQLLH